MKNPTEAAVELLPAWSVNELNTSGTPYHVLNFDELKQAMFNIANE